MISTSCLFLRKLLSSIREKTAYKTLPSKQAGIKSWFGSLGRWWSRGTAGTNATWLLRGKMAQSKHGRGEMYVCGELPVLGIQIQIVSVGSSTHAKNLVGFF